MSSLRLFHHHVQAVIFSLFNISRFSNAFCIILRVFVEEFPHGFQDSIHNPSLFVQFLLSLSGGGVQSIGTRVRLSL